MNAPSPDIYRDESDVDCESQTRRIVRSDEHTLARLERERETVARGAAADSVTKLRDTRGMERWEKAEPETLTNSNSSTRYFAVDVERPNNGGSAIGGRLNSINWRLNAHGFASRYGTDADFYVMATVGEGARIFVIDFEGMAGFLYNVLANTQGIAGHASRSWCQFGDPIAQLCPFFNMGPSRSASLGYRLYLLDRASGSIVSELPLNDINAPIDPGTGLLIDGALLLGVGDKTLVVKGQSPAPPALSAD